MNEDSATPSLETPPIETPPASGETPPTPETPPSLIGEATPPAPEFVPLTAEAFTFPEGFTVDEPLRDEALALFNNREMTEADRAAGLAELWTKGVTGLVERQQTEFISQQETRQAEVRADPALGGPKLEGTLQSIGKLMEEFGTAELRVELDASGVGNSIHMLRFLHSLAGKLTEGSIQPPGIAPAAAERSVADKMYPSMQG